MVFIKPVSPNGVSRVFRILINIVSSLHRLLPLILTSGFTVLIQEKIEQFYIQLILRACQVESNWVVHVGEPPAPPLFHFFIHIQFFILQTASENGNT